MKARQKSRRASATCPCEGASEGAHYIDCCGRYIEGQALAPDAEALMRSRYTAYVLGKADYLLATWHESTRPADLVLEAPGTPHGTRWLGLSVHSHTRLTDTDAQVMFTARYREAGKACRLKEHSRFVLEQGQWFYLDGKTSFE